ncbi:MAG: DMT family transporter [Spirochaetales bacterium]|nr:DMT family transporter [Spirochaetales bacterium]
MILSQIKKVIPDSTRGKGQLAALTGVFLLSFDSVFVRLSGVGGFDTNFLFGLFSAISMGVFIQITSPKGLWGTLKENGWPGLVSGLLILCSASSFVLSVKHTAVANTVIIISSRPVVTAVISWIILKEKANKSFWITVFVVFIGISIVVAGSLDKGGLFGDCLAVFSVISLGVNGTLWRKYKNINRMGIVGLGGFFIALVMFVPAHPASYSLKTWLIMAAMGLASAPIGRVLNATSTRYIPASETSMFSLINVVLAPAWAFLFFSEKPPVQTLIGGGIILTSIVVYLVVTARKKV